MKMNIKILFSDVDNTLAHKEPEHFKIPEEESYISKENAALLEEIKKIIPVILITGRRITGFERVSKIIPNSFGLIEHCCLLIKNGRPDKQYAREFKKYIGKPWKFAKQGLLWDYEQELKCAGWVVDSKDRYASFRIDPEKNNFDNAEIAKLLKKKHFEGIKTVTNGRYIDFIPPMGGKSHGINHVLIELGCRWKHIAAFGDDYNDAEMLKSAGFPFTISGARDEIISIVKKHGGYISRECSHKGTEDILKRILNMLQ
jgi:HAD superfamily hydrolase (TIGR01484 family)